MDLIIGARALLDMQSGDPRRLIRGQRKVILFPWKPLQPGEPGRALFVVTASDLLHWSASDVDLLESYGARALIRLQRPGSLTQQDVMALHGAEIVYVDIWAGDGVVRQQFLEVLLPNMEPITSYKM